MGARRRQFTGLRKSCEHPYLELAFSHPYPFFTIYASEVIARNESNHIIHKCDAAQNVLTDVDLTFHSDACPRRTNRICTRECINPIDRLT